VIPIAGFTRIDAGTASSSPFQPTTKFVHDHAGIVFTFRWNPRSRCAGNRDHEQTEYAPGTRIPSFGGWTLQFPHNGTMPNGYFSGTTSVTNEIRAWLEDDLKHLFEGLPSGDGAF
jgi:hypothetical protein